MQQSQTITRNSASNLALAFVLLPKIKRQGMAALYAFCREVDDVADNEAVPVERRRQRKDSGAGQKRSAVRSGVEILFHERTRNRLRQPRKVIHHERNSRRFTGGHQ